MSKAIIGVCTMELDLGGVDSLKIKRSILNSLFKRLQHQFNLTVAEIADQNEHEVAVIAFAVISNSTAHANSMVNTIVNWIEAEWNDGNVTDQQIEIL
jgi:uncharacterized protein YlxP (DUF503 family)